MFPVFFTAANVYPPAVFVFFTYTHKVVAGLID
jgi:hypothetical protein